MLEFNVKEVTAFGAVTFLNEALCQTSLLRNLRNIQHAKCDFNKE